MQWKVGCDVSKAKVDLAILVKPGKYRTKVFPNSTAGFKALVSWLDEQLPEGAASAHVCMESTGTYHEALALHLHDHGICVSVENPFRVKQFMSLEGVRNKTDAGDAKALARYCERQSPEPWEAPSRSVRELQALVMRLQTLESMRQSELNRLDTAHEAVKSSIQKVIDQLDTNIADVRKLIRSTIDNDPDLKRREALLDTIPGLGDKTIPQLLAFIGRPERFKNAKALVAYASLAPRIQQSGTSLNRTQGTHPQGNRELRQALFYPAMVAGKHNPIISAFWKRLAAQKKPGLVIVTACMRKLLAIVYGVLKTGSDFDPKKMAHAGT